MATHIPELIEFLDQHWCRVMTAQAAQDPLRKDPDEALSALQELRQGFLQELYQMSPEQLTSLVLEVGAEQDSERPFNSFGTDADFEHFGRCAFLIPSEAVALSLGKDPRFVDWEMVRPYLGHSFFAFEFAKRLDLIERAVVWQELGERFTPLEFLTWAHRYKLQVPQAFIQCTFVRGEPIQYWHELCEAQQVRVSEVEAELEAAHESYTAARAEYDKEAQRTFDEWLEALDEIERLQIDRDTQVTSLRGELEHMQSENSALKEKLQEMATERNESESLSTTERKSLLTIAIAAAIDGHGYSPSQKKSPIPKQIADAAHMVGLKISDDTVRKYLKEATTIPGFTNSTTDC